MQTTSIHNQITLIFPDMYKLRTFVQTVNLPSVEINTTNNSLICPCSELQISIAVTQYSATISQTSAINQHKA
jgi:hypothetical protein